jgi:hypothetical protein
MAGKTRVRIVIIISGSEGLLSIVCEDRRSTQGLRSSVRNGPTCDFHKKYFEDSR